MLGLKLGNAPQQRLVLRHQRLNARREIADLLKEPQHQRLNVIAK